MKTLILLSISLLLLGASVSSSEPKADVPSATEPAGHFSAVDVFIDPQGKPLAAYQFELSARGGAGGHMGGANVTLVGVEGGEHAAFATPPYYDPHANLEHRIVIAAFNTGTDLPTKKTRVARLMVHIEGSAQPQYTAQLLVAASTDAKPISATISVMEGTNQ